MTYRPPPALQQRLEGVTFSDSYMVRRGRIYVLGQPPEHIVIGRGLVPGQPYCVPHEILRCYVVAAFGRRAIVVDAVTGRLHKIEVDRAVETLRPDQAPDTVTA